MLRMAVSGIRTRIGGEIVLQIVDETEGKVWAWIPYSDKTDKQHIESYRDAQLFVDGYNNITKLRQQLEDAQVLLSRYQYPDTSGQ